MKRVFTCFLVMAVASQIVAQGGPWVVEKGKTLLSLGYSQKTAGQRWTPTFLDTKNTATGDDDVWGPDSLQTNATLVDGKFHDFRYVYLNFQFGLMKNLELSGNINYLFGYEAISSDPKTGAKLASPRMELNQGFTDAWLRLKYKLPVKIPMAIEINSRFPDLYEQPGHTYTRYNYQYTNIEGKKDTIVEASAEWRGLLKRDFALVYHIGSSFLKDGKLFAQGFAGYNWRQGAFADQFLAGATVGYTFKFKNGIEIVPNIYADLTYGLSNGGKPDVSDRFAFGGRKNYYFNNSSYLRTYFNVYAKLTKNIAVATGFGQWLWGKGAVKYSEPFAQVFVGF